MASSYTIDERDKALIDGLVDSGRYKSASDVIRAGLRLVAQREEDYEAELAGLRAEIQKGIDSGPGREVNPRKWAEEIKERGRHDWPQRRMANRVVVSPQADIDVDEAWSFVAVQSPVAANERIDRISSAAQTLAGSPRMAAHGPNCTIDCVVSRSTATRFSMSKYLAALKSSGSCTVAAMSHATT